MTFASGGNHGIFIFAEFYVRCRNWRRKEHIQRRKRSCRPRPTHSSGVFSPVLFGISLIFWNIFGVCCASSSVTTLSNSNSTHSTSKFNNNRYTNTEQSETTETLTTQHNNCDDKTKTCTNDNTNSNSLNVTMGDAMPSLPYEPSTCELNYTDVCNRRSVNVNETDDIIKKVCENYTCQYSGGKNNDESGYCRAQRCLSPSHSNLECAECLCKTLKADEKAKNYLTKFKVILSRFDCKKPYSLWNCTHCSAVYKDWLCATEGLYERDIEGRPCLGMCTSVMSHCPYLVPHKLYGGSPSFQCPKFSELSMYHPYARNGTCFKCEKDSRDFDDSTPCKLSYTKVSGASKGVAANFVLLVWLVFLMRISVYFNTASYL